MGADKTNGEDGTGDVDTPVLNTWHTASNREHKKGISKCGKAEERNCVTHIICIKVAARTEQDSEEAKLRRW